MNLGKEFSNKKICVKFNDINQIDTLEKVIRNWLFEDTHIINSKLNHGVYSKWLREGYELSVGITDDWAEVMTDEWFKDHGYKQVGYEEFIQNLREN